MPDEMAMDPLSVKGQAALYYAEKGWHVFPCHSNGKQPASWLVENGQHDATTDPAKIREWWRKEPNANIAVYLKPSGLVAVDADIYKPECEWRSFIADKARPDTLAQRSARGGWHYIFVAREGEEYGSPCKGVDVKHDGYLMLEPSEFEGKAYQFLEHSKAIADRPEWLRRQVSNIVQMPTRGGLTTIPPDVLQRIATSFAQGERSSAFQSVVNSCVNRGLSIEAVEQAMRAHPYGVANKFLEPTDRLARELVRSWSDALRPQGSTPPPRPRRKFALEAIGSLRAVEPVYLIQGLIEAGCLGMLFGDPGVGKSFLALDWALCIAAGIPCREHEVKQGPVVYIAGEGHSGLVRRCHAWAAHHGIDLNTVPFFLSRGPTDMTDRAAMDEVKEVIRSLGISPAVIVTDTVARNFGAGDENSTKDMSAFIAAADDLKEAFPGSVVLLVHHSGHAEKQRARGSMALKGALDFEYRLDTKGDKLLLTNTKMKDAPPPAPQVLELRQIALACGTTSAVLVQGQAQEGQGLKLTAQQQQALDAYVAAGVAHGVYDPQGALVSVPVEAWRAEFYEMQGDKKQDTKKAAFKAARDALSAKGIITEDCEPDHPRQMQITMKRRMRGNATA